MKNKRLFIHEVGAGNSRGTIATVARNRVVSYKVVLDSDLYGRQQYCSLEGGVSTTFVYLLYLVYG